VILLAMPFTAHADVVMGNDFAERNNNHLVYLNRTFIVESPRGYVIQRKRPGSIGTIGDKYNNGELIYISATILYNGNYWGVLPYSHTHSPPGWIKMDELLLTYASSDFWNENFNSFYKYTGNFEAFLEAEELVFWQWPGSDREKKVIENIFTEEQMNTVRIDRTYKDEDGREWIYAWIDDGWRDGYGGWINLTDPGNINDLSPFKPAPEPVKWVPNTEHMNIISPMLMIVILVIFLSVVFIIIKVVKRRNKNGK
jgi:hypothetical protein